MTIGTVVKQVTLSKSIPCLQDRKLFLVRVNGSETVALDQAEVTAGDRVLLIMGPGARHLTMEDPVDAVILGVFAENS